MGFVLPLLVAAVGVWIAFSIVVWATGRDTLLDLSPAGAPPGLGEGEPVDESAIASVRFDTGLRGYRTTQVDAALNRLAWEIGRKDEQLAVLRSRLEDAGLDAAAESAPESVDSAPVDPAAVDADADAAEREAGREDSGGTAPRDDA
ncbi:DivIVA domain-containing protein [Glycomyces paridis]|uniref:DivIVA domain-containing protein n=1 Tax=Glycomyces paridis TaxID=2126555 RepID=UPI00130523B0|nr:DivIVA domain-containing protein [Glycomyces paridis]